MGDDAKENPKKVNTYRGGWEFTQNMARSAKGDNSSRVAALCSLLFLMSVYTDGHKDVAETPKKAGNCPKHTANQFSFHQHGAWLFPRTSELLSLWFSDDLCIALHQLLNIHPKLLANKWYCQEGGAP